MVLTITGKVKGCLSTPGSDGSRLRVGFDQEPDSVDSTKQGDRHSQEHDGGQSGSTCFLEWKFDEDWSHEIHRTVVGDETLGWCRHNGAAASHHYLGRWHLKSISCQFSHFFYSRT